MPASNAIYITELQDTFTIPEDTTFNDGSASPFIDAIKKANRLPLSKGDIFYSDDLWDFSGYTSLPVNKKNFKFYFSSMGDSPFKEDVKNFILISILENKLKLQSIYKRFGHIKSFFSFIETNYHIYNVKDISTPIVKGYIQTVRDSGSVTKLRDTKSVLKAFFLQYSVNFADTIPNGMLDLFEQDNYRMFREYQLEHRTKDIPNAYFDLFEAACIQMMNDPSVPFYHRGTACVYILLAETGLRIGEILGLNTHALKTNRIFNGEEANYLEYFTWKRENGNNTKTSAITYINKLSRKAYDNLISIYKDRRKDYGLDLLYMGGKLAQASSFPYDSERFKKIAFQFFIELDSRGLLKTVNLPNDEYPTVHRFNVENNKHNRSARLPDVDVTTLTFPTSQQFRFHCCTVLANKGVPLEYIQRFMSHLTDDMVRYHILPTKAPQENMDFSLKVLREVVSGKTKILGGDKGLSDRIQQFIEKNHFHIETDLDAICEKLAKNIPIRQKTGGVCIKSSQLRDCSIDAKTNEFYCAYGVCPNIVHFYYMADVSYRQCKELQESIRINNERGHKRQVQKEQNMLFNIASNRLAPELVDLKAVISRDGLESVFTLHPELKDIIENMEEIEKEVAVWTSKIQ